MKERSVDMGTGLVLCLLTFFLMGQLEGVPREGVLLPKVVLWALTGCGITLSLTAWYSKNDAVTTFLEDLNARHFVIVVLAFMISVCTSLCISFYSTIFFMCFGVTTAIAEKRDRKIIVSNAFFSAATVLFIYLFFTKLMHVQFPEALLS